LAGAKIAVAYIYCQHDEPATLSAPGILSSLIKQLLLQLEVLPDSDDGGFRETLAKAQRQGRVQLDADDLMGTFKILIGKFDQTFVIIDGLDECDAIKSPIPGSTEVSGTLLRLLMLALKTISPGMLKIFLASRPEVDVRRMIPDSYHIQLSVKNVEPDIATLIEEEVEDKIWIAGKVEDYDLVQRIKRELLSGAQGM
jgi:hypothetical protein